MNRWTLIGLLALGFATACTGNNCESDGTCETEDTDTDNDTDGDTGTDTDTGTDSDSGTDTDTDTDTDTTADECADQGRFRCEGGTSTCARVCGKMGGALVKYYIDERELLNEVKCNLDSDEPLRVLLADASNEEYLLVNVVEKKFEAYSFPIGVSIDNAQVEFAQERGTRSSWGTSAKSAVDGSIIKYGKGTGEVFVWNEPSPDGDGTFLMKLTVTEAYKKANGKLDAGDDGAKAGVVEIEVQGVCK